jgi:hypothetical protein
MGAANSGSIPAIHARTIPAFSHHFSGCGPTILGCCEIIPLFAAMRLRTAS